MSKLDTQDFVTYEVPEGAHVLSVYLQTHSAESETVLRNQLKEIEQRFESEDEQRELDQCVGRIWDFLTKFEARTPMLVLFCTATGSMWVRQIDVVLPNAVRWEEYAYWKPLVEAIDEFEPYGVLLLNDEKARLFDVFLGNIHECYSLQRGSADDLTAYLKNVSDKVQELMRTECPRRIVLAGDRSIWSQFLRPCPSYLRKAIIAMKNMSVDASPQQVMELTRELEELAERRFEIRQIDSLVGLAAGHKKVVLGLTDTLDALNNGRVWCLVYSEGFAARGGHCLICGSEFVNDIETCKKCNVAVRPEDDLLSAMIARSLNSDASIEQVRGEAADRLNELGGIGAFLRY